MDFIRSKNLNELVEKEVFFSEGKTGKGTVYKLKGPKEPQIDFTPLLLQNSMETLD